MRNIVLLASVLTTLASTSFVSGAPTSYMGSNTALVRRTPADQIFDSKETEALGISHPSNTTPGDHPADSGNTGGQTSYGKEDPTGPKNKYGSYNNHPRSDSDDTRHKKRATDNQTAGGNAYTGSTGDVSSGDVTNDAGSGTVTNNGGSKYTSVIEHMVGNSVSPSDNSQMGGSSLSGNADGGDGDGNGPGGNAYTGNTGDARGGSIYNIGGTVNNAGANESESSSWILVSSSLLTNTI